MKDEIIIEKEIPKSLLKWYTFKETDSVIYIGEKTDSIYELFLDLKRNHRIKNVNLVCETDIYKIDKKNNINPEYDIAVWIRRIEECAYPEQVLNALYKITKPNATLLLAFNNRFGIRYFCGDRDPYTNRVFDSIENYRKVVMNQADLLSGRMYDKARISELLTQSGFINQVSYSVFPGLDDPRLIFSDTYTPNEELNVRCIPIYNYPDTVFLEEEYLYSGLIKNDLFHKMANAYLIICRKNKDDNCRKEVLHVTSSIDRGEKDGIFTIIYSDDTVEKRAIYSEGKNRLRQLYLNNEALRERGIHVIDAALTGDSYIMPYINAKTALTYLCELAQESSLKKFILEMDRFKNQILQSSDIYEKKENGKTERFFRKGFYDLIPLNCFILKGEYIFYDQEFAIEDCQVGIILSRFVDLVYSCCPEIERKISRKFFMERYGIWGNIEEYRRKAQEYLIYLRKENELRGFYQKRRNGEIVQSNRNRMNYSEEEYQRKFVDIFRNLGDRKLILFGSGAFTKRFIAMYGKSYEIACILDNNEDRLGQRLDGYEIKSPEYLNELSKEDYKVLICIKSYVSVAKQLESMGITDYGIFDTSRSYAKPAYRQEGIDSRTALPARAARPQQAHESGTEMKKKYHIGYVAGVFDMFHTGHVRLLQRAKELCDYLIVGVVSDEDCYRQKNKYPVISCEDRVEVVKACRYADQVEALPTGFGGIRDAYKMFQFDVQFSGDDHGDDGSWLAEKEYLNKHGADLVFFDYTKGISSTEIRERL